MEFKGNNQRKTSVENYFKKSFYHQRIKYQFQWDIQNHIRLKKQNQKNIEELWKFLKRISREEYPLNWFNDFSIKRISNFKLCKLQRGLVPNIGKQLIKEGIIQVEKRNNEIVKLTNDIHQVFAEIPSKKPGHEEVLNVLIKKDKNAIASEVPVWNSSPENITGHIDLIRIEDGRLNIVDYKPEGNFMRSIPQVAYYGIAFDNILNQHNKMDIFCSSFNRKEIWHYEPIQLFTRLDEILLEHKKVFDWQKFVNDFIV